MLARRAVDCSRDNVKVIDQNEKPSVPDVELVAMRHFKIGLKASLSWLVVVAVLGLLPLRAQTPSAAVMKIQTYYQQLMPTIQQAGRLSVRERDRRFTPVISAIFPPRPRSMAFTRIRSGDSRRRR